MPKKKLNFKFSDDMLKKQLDSFQAYDLAIIFPYLEDIEKERLLEFVDIKKTLLMFSELDLDDQKEMLSLMSLERQKEFLRSLESDDLKEFIEELEDAEEQKNILSLLPKVKKKTIELLMSYDEDLAASIMTTEFIVISKDAAIKEATNQVVTTSKEQDYIDTVFIVDEHKTLIGMLDLKQLIIARSDDQLTEIMVEDFPFVYEEDSIEKAITTVRDYDRNVIPVLNHEHKLLGIVTADDIFDELIESNEYDYQKMALLNDHENTSSAWKRSKQRLPWLMIAVLLNLVIASFLSIFEATLVEVIALALFQPLILGMAGNIGTQSLAVTILGIHLDELDDQKMPKKFVLKETLVGLLNSSLLGIAAFVFVISFLTLIPTGSQRAMDLAFVVSFAVFTSMFVSSLMGFVIPLTLNRFKIDPSVASGPIITTINDVVALVIYFGAATIAFMI